jgi:hypothetical protein
VPSQVAIAVYRRAPASRAGNGCARAGFTYGRLGHGLGRLLGLDAEKVTGIVAEDRGWACSRGLEAALAAFFGPSRPTPARS